MTSDGVVCYFADTRVMEVVAEDMDDDQLRYSIVPRADDPLDGSGLFAIDSQTGVVTTQAEPDELDAETQNTYNILVNATDGRSFGELNYLQDT